MPFVRAPFQNFEGNGGAVNCGYVLVSGSKQERVAPGSTGEVERRALGEQRQQLANEAGWLGSCAVSCGSMLLVPLRYVAKGHEKGSWSYQEPGKSNLRYMPNFGKAIR